MRILAFVGFYSYSIYLWHNDVRLTVYALVKPINANHFDVVWLLGTGAYVCFAVAVGVLMGTFIEMKAIRFRDRFFPDHASLMRGRHHEERHQQALAFPQLEGAGQIRRSDAAEP
jgi:peptidoglycan/LPS O-acetylase OafA/YrhL